MCGRSSLTKTEKEIEQRFRATFYSEELERYNPLPNYNVAPTHFHPIVLSRDAQHIHLFQWGLVPSWAKDKKMGSSLINARVETILEKPVFNKLLNKKRCIIPLDGFYEWKRDGKMKIPYRIVTTDQDIFSVAGLWESWLNPESNQIMNTFTVITQAPNALMAKIHDRMPAILSPSDEPLWLDESLSPKDALSLIRPYDDDKMEAYLVSNEVNKVKNNHSKMIEKVSESKDIQMTLF